MTEAATTQAAIIDRLSQPDLGWQYVPGAELPRELTDVLIEDDAVEALKRLNPLIARHPEYAEEILQRLRALILAVYDDGVVKVNEAMMGWLRGLEEHQFVGELVTEPINLIDFDNPRANKLVVSTEVVLKVGAQQPRRYDIVLFVNGIPLVVGETKTPFKDKTSWLNGALDITDTYIPETPGFFAANVLCFASEGKEFRYGSLTDRPEDWLPWGKTTDELQPPSLAKVLREAELLLTPELVLEILRSYTLYETRVEGEQPKLFKIIPRYPQVESVELIVRRALDPARHKGLIWHHQGSGKTILMAFAAAKLRRELNAPTVVIALDRLELTEQLGAQFRSAGIPQLSFAESREELQRMLGEHDRRGVIVTTIFRFKDAGLLNERSNIVVMCDEAHRTQEGQLGRDMRAALPNATYIGLTGTPIADGDHDTYTTFGDPDDPDQILNAYTPERSIADGATLQVITEARLVDVHIDKAALDQAFDEMTAEEGLTEEEKELLARKATRFDTIMAAPERIRRVCADIVEHYTGRVAPLGLKAQVVCANRDLCVAYQNEIQRLLDEQGNGWQSTVVMTVSGKEDGRKPEFLKYQRDRQEEARIKNRFRSYSDPLKFLIVTAKLLTGFNAPIEGVMYLDKPLRRHTLFQALTRPNRPWTNPETGQQKTAGLVVDYIGLGTEIAEAVQMKRRKQGEQMASEQLDILREELASLVDTCLERFNGIDREKADFETLMAAQQRLAEEASRDEFAAEFLKAEALFELLSPDDGLDGKRADYRWLAKIYQSIQPATSSDALLWQRLGAKTHALITQHISGVEIGAGGPVRIVLDDESIQQLKILGLVDSETDGGDRRAAPSAEEVLDSIEKRLAARLSKDSANPVYRSLAERLDALRQAKIETAEESTKWLKQLLEVARALVEADRREVAEHGAAAVAGGEIPEPELLLPDQRTGALTQLFREYRPDDPPEIIERVVNEIDAVVMSIRFSGWQTSREGDRVVKFELRKALKKFGIEPTGELFDKAYAYVAEHY
jgi:type I restriction enzyme R subunit